MGRMDDGCYPLDSYRHGHWKGTLLHVHKESEKDYKESYRWTKWVLKLKSRITMCNSLHTRPIKQGLNQQGYQLINRSFNILKSEAIIFFPHYQH